MNEKNLIPNSERTPQELKEMTRKGGIASGIARREKKRMREWAEVLGQMPTKIATTDGEEIDSDNLGAVIHAQIEKAKKGDTAAAKFLADLLGEMEQNVNLGTTDGMPLGLNIVDTRKVHRSPLIIEQTPEGEATEHE